METVICRRVTFVDFKMVKNRFKITFNDDIFSDSNILIG